MTRTPGTTWQTFCVVLLVACASALVACSTDVESDEPTEPTADLVADEASESFFEGEETVETEIVDGVETKVTWRNANLTHFTSYPAEGSEECEEYNGCQWAGYFAFVNGRKSRQWVRDHNIAAVHSRHANQYKLKTLRLKKGSREIDVKVYDMCADSDCNGCCTRNMRETGFLIDIEKYTKQRFGSGSGTVKWRCLDC